MGKAKPFWVEGKKYESRAKVKRALAEVLTKVGETQDLQATASSTDYEFVLGVIRNHWDSTTILANVSHIELKPQWTSQAKKLQVWVHSKMGGEAASRSVSMNTECIDGKEANPCFGDEPFDVSRAHFSDE